jgi:uncharacterized membrane protein YkvA (DUF1232 family)
MSTPFESLPEVQPYYSESGFWAKLRRHARKLSQASLEKALWLYYAAQKPGVPAWARTTICGALGYLIWPADALPDVIPVVGFTDDLGVISAALAVVALHIDTEVKEQARRKLEDWFG